MDVSFISVSKVLPAVAPLAGPNADFLILVKPQFELERAEIDKGGIVKDDTLHQKAIDRVQSAARGTPILGDRLYGAQRGFTEAIALHARSLVVEHPILRKPIEIVAPLPDSWRDQGIVVG